MEKIKVPRFTNFEGFSTTPERSKIMAKIRNKNTKPELLIRKKLWHMGYRYRVDYKSLPGKPDIVFTKYKIAIFIDGEFWHGYNWKEKKNRIKKNRKFWIAKIERNMQRDEEVNRKLLEMGYIILRFWENIIKKETDNCISEIVKCIESCKEN